MNVKDLYSKFGQSTRALDFGKDSYKIPSKINRKVEVLMGAMLANASLGGSVDLSKFLGRVASRWSGKGTFGTSDMFSPSDLVQALRLFYAKTALGELSFKDGLLMAEVIENKSNRQLLLTFRKFVPELMHVSPADPVAPKTSKQADKTLSAILEKADLSEPAETPKAEIAEPAETPALTVPETVAEADKIASAILGLLDSAHDVEIKAVLEKALTDIRDIGQAYNATSVEEVA